MLCLSFQRNLALTLCLILVALGMSVPPSAQAEQVQGLVAEAPAEGPSIKTDRGYMVPYTTTIPGTDVQYEMVPVPGGKFKLGSPEGEAGRRDDEGPQVEVVLPPFWIGKHEVTWSEYQRFMELYTAFKEFDMLRTTLHPEFASHEKNPEKKAKLVARQEKLRELLKQYSDLSAHVTSDPAGADAITIPTELYDPSHTYEVGDEPRHPAVTMTQYAAKHYTKWLSRISGHSLRLPSEAEWEYACRAGTTTAYHFGDDPKLLGEYDWYFDNADEQLHEVGTKKPNPWGLYDMHGNVAEWVLDAYTDDGYARFEKNPVASSDAVAWPTELYPRVVRGGNWDADAKYCRSAVRLPTDDEEWKDEDPNIPLSPWWFTTDPARGVGFRMVRTLEPMTDAQKQQCWEADVEDIKWDVKDRLTEGRGIQDIAHPNLPKVLEQLKAIKEEL